MKRGTPQSRTEARRRLVSARQNLLVALTALEQSHADLAHLVGASDVYDETTTAKLSIVSLLRLVHAVGAESVDLDEMAVEAINARGEK